MINLNFMHGAKFRDDDFLHGESVIWLNWEEVYQLFHQDALNISIVSLWLLQVVFFKFYSLTYMSNKHYYITSTYIDSLFYFVSYRMEIQTYRKKGTTTSASSTHRLWTARIYVLRLKKHSRTYTSTYLFSAIRLTYCFCTTLGEYFLPCNSFSSV